MSLREWGLNRLSGGDYSEQMGAIREAIDWFVERAKEDVGWKKATSGDEEDKAWDRDTLIPLARRAFDGNDPFIKRGVQTATEFCFGNGIDGPAGEGDGMEALLGFWHDPMNQMAMFSTAAQYKRSNQLLIDGDLFLVLFVSDDNGVQVRRLGSLLVDDIISDPDDACRPLYYKIKRTRRVYSAGSNSYSVPTEPKIVYYKDYLNRVPELDPYTGEEFELVGDGDVYMMHVSINNITDGSFGTSDVAASLRWLIRAKQIAEDQATISRMTAALMLMARLKGGAAAVDEFTDQLVATFGTSEHKTAHGAEQTLAPPGGSVTSMSDDVELDLSRADTRAAGAWQNNRMMRVPAVAGMGTALHYLGDPENANLATATKMELPIMKHYTAYQAIWIGVYRQLFDFVLAMGDTTAEYDIPVPPMVEPEIEGMAGAIVAGQAAGDLTREQAARRFLLLLGFDNIEKEIEAVLATDVPAPAPEPEGSTW